MKSREPVTHSGQRRSDARYTPYPARRLQCPTVAYWTQHAERLVLGLMSNLCPVHRPHDESSKSTRDCELGCSKLTQDCLSRLSAADTKAVGKFQCWLPPDHQYHFWEYRDRYEVYLENNADIIAEQERAFKNMFDTIENSAEALGISAVKDEAQASLADILNIGLAAKASEEESHEAEVTRMGHDLERNSFDDGV